MRHAANDGDAIKLLGAGSWREVTIAERPDSNGSSMLNGGPI